MWGIVRFFRAIRLVWVAGVIFMAFCLVLLSGCKGLSPSPGAAQKTLLPPTKPTPGIIRTTCLATCVFYPVKTWEDLDQDGIYDNIEPPLPGVQVHLIVTPIGDYYTSEEKTDTTGSALLCFGVNNCSRETQRDLSIEVVAIAPDGCKDTTKLNLPETPEQKANHWNQPDNPYTFGFWCGREPSSTSINQASTLTPECIGDAWSYAENVQTDIEITPDLKVTINRFAPDVVNQTSVSSTITIYGDGRVVYTSETHQASGSTKNASVEKHISKDQLQQIVSLFEVANFYAINPGCGGVVIAARDAPNLDILIETRGKIHEIKDNGACAVYHFDKYCDLGDKVDDVLGTPW